MLWWCARSLHRGVFGCRDRWHLGQLSLAIPPCVGTLWPLVAYCTTCVCRVANCRQLSPAACFFVVRLPLQIEWWWCIDRSSVFCCTYACALLAQAGSRRGSRRAMLRTYALLKLSRTDTQLDTQMDRWMDRHCATIRASLACASRANRVCIHAHTILQVKLCYAYRGKRPWQVLNWVACHGLLAWCSIPFGSYLARPVSVCIALQPNQSMFTVKNLECTHVR